MEHDHAFEEAPPSPVNWWPTLFSVFIVFFPLALLRRGNATASDWVLTAFAVVAFTGLTATALAYWRRRGPFLWVPIVLAVVGFALAPYNSTAVLFFLFAAGIFPWAVDGHVQRSATLAMLLMIYAEWVMAVLVPVPAIKRMWLIDVPILTIGNVAGGVWIVRMTLSIRRLGRIAIRERITRELHDVLGSALAVITLKSELVARLVTQSAEVGGARHELAEIESISRLALADVRQAIRRYRADVPEAGLEPIGARRREGDNRARPAEERVSAPINWWPMIFTIYIVFLPTGFYRAGGGSALEWLLVALGVVAFLALAASAVVCWQRRRPFLWVVFLLTLLGIAFAHLTASAMIFIAFAAALVPWAVNGDIWRTVWLMTALLAVELFIGAWTAFLHPEAAAALREVWWITVPVFTAISTAGYLWAVRMSLRHLDLARVAERERIARDLHDVVGHTLSLITLKSELAGRLLAQGRDIERTRSEIGDVDAISRQALAEVRRAILGDRLDTIDTEFERATSTLRTAGIAVECERESVRLDTTHESILGFALREAVTNVVRHAEARKCSITLHQIRGAYVLEVQDDGRGGTEHEGLGLRSMRERIEALGGSVLREVSAGTRLTVRLPTLQAPI